MLGTCSSQRINKRIYFKREGSKNNQSANLLKSNHLFKTWSSNSSLEAERAYNPFQLLRKVEGLESKSDFQNAIKRIKSLI
jgi:hypothetical protein